MQASSLTLQPLRFSRPGEVVKRAQSGRGAQSGSRHSQTWPRGAGPRAASGHLACATYTNITQTAIQVCTLHPCETHSLTLSLLLSHTRTHSYPPTHTTLSHTLILTHVLTPTRTLSATHSLHIHHTPSHTFSHTGLRTLTLTLTSPTPCLPRLPARMPSLTCPHHLFQGSPFHAPSG